MTVLVRWLVPDRIISIQFSGSIDLDDYDSAMRETLVMLDEGIAPVHVLCDLRDVTDYPFNIAASINLLKGGTDPHTKTGWIMLMSHNAALRFAATVITQMFGRSLRFQTIAELHDALSFIVSRDQALESVDMNVVESTYRRIGT